MRSATGRVMHGGLARSRARAVGSFVPTLTRKAFEKYGFSTATLLTEWAAIAGEELASYTLPERLTWPRQAGGPDESGTDERGRSGAKLLLRVDTARVLDVEYRKHQIIERINAHFGYRAVAELRFMQAPVRRTMAAGSSATAKQKPRDVVRTAAAPAKPQSPVVGTSDLPELDAALARLAASVLTRRS